MTLYTVVFQQTNDEARWTSQKCATNGNPTGATVAVFNDMPDRHDDMHAAIVCVTYLH